MRPVSVDDQNSITRPLSDSEERRRRSERLCAETFLRGCVERVHFFAAGIIHKTMCETGCNRRMSVSVKKENHVRVLRW